MARSDELWIETPCGEGLLRVAGGEYKCNYSFSTNYENGLNFSIRCEVEEINVLVFPRYADLLIERFSSPLRCIIIQWKSGSHLAGSHLTLTPSREPVVYGATHSLTAIKANLMNFGGYFQKIPLLLEYDSWTVQLSPIEGVDPKKDSSRRHTQLSFSVQMDRLSDMNRHRISYGLHCSIYLFAMAAA